MRTVTFKPPSDALFAAVQVDVPDPDGRDGRRVVGAAPAFRVTDDDGRMVPLAHVAVHCDLQPGDVDLRAVWAYEDAARPNEQTTASLAGTRRRLGG